MAERQEHEEQGSEVQAIRIDLAGRYLLVVTAPKALDAEEAIRAQGLLNQWWKSGQKFLVLGIRPDVRIQLERVDTPE